MDVERKPDADAIREFVQGLVAALHLTDDRRVWPAHLFHITSLESAMAILGSGSIVNRSDLVQEGRLLWDSANPEVIAETSEDIKGCARLYFRPRTPTQFHMEGFRPVGDSKNKRHGMSVAFVFDSLDILTRRTTQFTDRNPGHRESQTGADADFLKTIPFADVYHDTYLSERKREITSRRCAEVLVPHRLELASALRGVRVRTSAERDTLLYLLRTESPDAFDRHRPSIRANIPSPQQSSLFFRKWCFVDQVSFLGTRMTIQFSTETEVREAMQIEVSIFGLDGQGWDSTGLRSLVPKGPIALDLPTQCRSEPFVVDVRLDHRIAYKNTFPPLEYTLLSGTRAY